VVRRIFDISRTAGYQTGIGNLALNRFPIVGGLPPR
jgi:hypothetical protein